MDANWKCTFLGLAYDLKMVIELFGRDFGLFDVVLLACEMSAWLDSILVNEYFLSIMKMS